jgi:hypothetical protein
MEMKMKAKKLLGLTFPSLAAAINAAKSQRTGHIEKWNSVSKKGGRNQVWFEWRPTDATLGSKSGEITPGKASCTHEVVARIMGDCVLTATDVLTI